MDIPVSTSRYFNKEKGIRFGQNMRKAKEEGSISFGLANGFSGPKSGIRRNAASLLMGPDSSIEGTSGQSVEELLPDFRGAEARGQVLNKKILGGQITRGESGKPIYMLGSFRGSQFISKTSIFQRSIQLIFA